MKTRTYSTVDWRKYLLEESNSRVKNFLDSRGLEVFNQICSSINQAVIHNRDKVVMLIHPNAGNVILITRSEYMEVYNIAMKWFEKNEHYEMCSTLKSWKDNLNSKKKFTKQNIKSFI